MSRLAQDPGPADKADDMQRLDATPLALAALLIASPAAGDSMFKCTRSKIIHIGDSTGIVRTKCGKPKYRDVQVLGGGADNRIEIWGYGHFTDSRWLYELRFKNGVLSDIRSLGWAR
jgi:hypothetical protein